MKLISLCNYVYVHTPMILDIIAALIHIIL